MPNKDGTGPAGKGPLTGCGSGLCIVSITSPKEELDYLKKRQNFLKTQLKNIETRVRRIEAVTSGGEK